MKWVLLGASGHAKVIVEILREADDWEVVGCLSADSTNGPLLGIPILGDDSELEAIFQRGVTHAFAAIGHNGIRSRVCDRVRQIGFSLINAVSRRAVVSPSIRLETGIAIMPGAVINAESGIGSGAIVNTGATIDHDCRIGNFSHVGPGSNLAGGVTVGTGAFLGVGCSVIPEIVIGEWSMVGAGCTVITDIPPHVTAVGVPARVIKRSSK